MVAEARDDHPSETAALQAVVGTITQSGAYVTTNFANSMRKAARTQSRPGWLRWRVPS